MTLPTLPEGARLALMNWPGGQPSAMQIGRAADRDLPEPLDAFQIIRDLMEARLIERRPAMQNALPTYRLTQAGRKAWDVLQSGVE